MIRDGYIACWKGGEYEASPDGAAVRLYAGAPVDGFEPVGPDRYRRVVPAGEAELTYVRTVCLWRGEPFCVLAARDGRIRIEYTGGRAPVARRLGLDAIDVGVYQAWVPFAEVYDLAEERR